MTASKDADFDHFSADAFRFLAELEGNNERTWFKANQARYESALREPARAFVRAVGARLGAVTDHLRADDRKVGGSLMRIHRDVRFSKDKSPYKNNVGVHFRHAAGKDVHAPGLYVHLANDECFVGVGIWGPPTPALNAIRAKIDAEQARWREIVEAPEFVAAFRREGETLKRPPRGYAKDHPCVEDLKRKHHIAVCDIPDAVVESPELVDFTLDQLRRAASYMGFLCEALEVAF